MLRFCQILSIIIIIASSIIFATTNGAAQNETCEKVDPDNNNPAVKEAATPLNLSDIEGSLFRKNAILNFSEGISPHLYLPESETWRKAHIILISLITKLHCNEEILDPGFVNTVANIILLYYGAEDGSGNSMNTASSANNNKNDDDGEVAMFWEKTMVNVYKECANVSRSLTFSTRGGLVTEYGELVNDDDETSTAQVQMTSFEITRELADNLPFLDIVIDSIWFIYQITAAICYTKSPSRVTWASEFFNHFRKDFLDPIESSWGNPKISNYGPIFGDIDIYQNLYNLRACATAQYQYLKLEYIIPVRPLRLHEYDDDLAMNKRVFE